MTGSPEILCPQNCPQSLPVLVLRSPGGPGVQNGVKPIKFLLFCFILSLLTPAGLGTVFRAASLPVSEHLTNRAVKRLPVYNYTVCRFCIC